MYIHVCMYVCLYACMHVCMCVSKYVRMFVCMYVCIYVCMYVYIYTHILVCMYIRMYVYICIYIYTHTYISTYICVCVCMCACACACVCIYIHITHSVGAGDPSQSKIGCRSLARPYAVLIYCFGVCVRESLLQNPLPTHPSPLPTLFMTTSTCKICGQVCFWESRTWQSPCFETPWQGPRG